ncbi:gamma-glutamyl-gamma-aminobutyrate hydrolase family protein [Spiribacter sp. SSL99]|uniref:gamma-glutamyl-gamma-aminobutyrate hydrolase family protein n=1 Tax=Spiribacter sp. SSL99 TaxID=1866884 RepID=UPI00190F6515|nr:gamma-glutamyl-gamma-aminobutyrate hydrolase family protein [Spiribacter sp. SSL99]
MKAIAEHGERRDCLDQRWIPLLEALELDPVPIPNGLSNPADWGERQGLSGLILTGGNDIAHMVDARWPAPERDRTETALLEWTAAAGMPVLGVCRGLQMINHHCGGRLVPVDGHVATRHPLQTAGDDRLLATHWEVNSFHDWGIPACDLAASLRPLAWSEDCCIEAAVHKRLPWLAIMWHPERETPFAEADLTLIGRLLND